MKIKPDLKKTAPCFTLAEVLITLVVIGVIAAIAVPLIITSYQKEVTIEKLKKTYSALAQTTARAIADNGPIQSWDTIDSSDFSEKYLLPYLNIGKKCSDSAVKDCYYKRYNLNGSSYTNNNQGFYLADGVLVLVGLTNQNDKRIYSDLDIDINGSSKPNRIGRDIFKFRYEIRGIPQLAGKFMPPDYDTVSRSTALNHPDWGCNKSGNGSYCSNVIMKDGWQIKDDYPW